MIAEQTRSKLAQDPAAFLRHLSEEDRRMAKLAEAIDLANSLIDPSEAYRDGSENWLPIGRGFTGVGNGMSGNIGLGLLTSGFDNELELAMARDEMRYLHATNPYAINVGENRVSYIVGDGHTYDVAGKRSKGAKVVSPDEALIEAAQEALDTFIEENDWNIRQQETVERLDRDGEVFLRFFPGTDGVLRVRFVEPGHVQTPPSKVNDPNVRFGIEYDPDDAEQPVNYFIRGETVPAAEIQHRKANVDRTTPRGVPLLFGMRHYLRRAAKNVLNISAKIDVISSISLIRKHASSTAAGVQSVVSAAAQFQRTDPRSGQQTYARRFAPGTILDTSDQTTYEAPQVDGVDQLSAGVALNLRCIASRAVMPEFMVSSDASNANYASTMVAEGPSVKQFEKLQKRQSCWDLVVMWKAIEAAGVGELKELKKLLEIRVGMPTIISRDDLKKAQENQIYFDEGILSPQEWSSQIGVDYEKNQGEIAKHKGDGRTYKPGEPSGIGAPPLAGEPLKPENPNDPLHIAVLKAKAEGATPEELQYLLAEFASAAGIVPLCEQSDGDGRWVTINGSPVFIDKGGTIAKGPSGFVGKKPSDLEKSGSKTTGKTTDRPKIGTKHIAADSPMSSAAASIIDSWATPATGSRDGDYAAVRADAEAWVKGENRRGFATLYKETQAGLKARGITEATLYRGIALPGDHPLAKAIAAGKAKPGSVLKDTEGMTAVSWSDQEGAAEGFARQHRMASKDLTTVGIVLERVVPAEDVIATHVVHRGFIGGENEWIARNKGKVTLRIKSIISPIKMSESVETQSDEGLSFDFTATDDQRGIATDEDAK